VAFKKGQSGNPAGRGSDKPWKRALERHAAQNPDKLARLAAATFDKAIEGDMAATREIGDRLDGKPAQAIEMSGSLDSKTASELTIEQLRHIAAGGSAGDFATDRSTKSLN